MRSEKYRRQVASLPCARCGIEGYSQCAHANGHKYGKGRGLKADDRASFPLCCTRVGTVGCHVRHDQYMDYDREQAREREDKWIAWTRRQLCDIVGK